MFANFIISSEIVQPDQDINQYHVSMGNVFKIPEPGAIVSLQALLVIGDYQQVTPGTKMEVIMRRVHGEAIASVIQSSELPVIEDVPSVTFTIGFNNLTIPKAGIYQFTVEINGNVMAANAIKFEIDDSVTSNE